MKILLIEDDRDDIELLEEALHSKGIDYEIDIKTDGSSAVEYLNSSVENPDIIIMDLNIPKIHGKEVMIEIKSLPLFKNIPLLILTTSSAKEDIEYAYQKGADKYLIKPTSLKQINDTVDIVVTLAQKGAYSN